MTALRFYLVRHARAEAHRGGDDASRRLTAEGGDRFRAHARELAATIAVSRIATSPLARARETANLFAAATGAPVHEEAALASGVSSGREVLRLGRRLGPGAALVGHNPELAEAVAIAAGKSVALEPGAVAAVDANASGFRLAWIRAPG